MSIRNFITNISPRRDPNGGVEIPEDQVPRAKPLRLLTLPRDVPGKNCANCDYFNENMTCRNPKLHGMKVNEHMCCDEWFHPGVFESWEALAEKKAAEKKAKQDGKV